MNFRIKFEFDQAKRYRNIEKLLNLYSEAEGRQKQQVERTILGLLDSGEYLFCVPFLNPNTPASAEMLSKAVQISINCGVYVDMNEYLKNPNLDEDAELKAVEFLNSQQRGNMNTRTILQSIKGKKAILFAFERLSGENISHTYLMGYLDHPNEEVRKKAEEFAMQRINADIWSGATTEISRLLSIKTSPRVLEYLNAEAMRYLEEVGKTIKLALFHPFPFLKIPGLSKEVLLKVMELVFKKNDQASMKLLLLKEELTVEEKKRILKRINIGVLTGIIGKLEGEIEEIIEQRAIHDFCSKQGGTIHKDGEKEFIRLCLDKVIEIAEEKNSIEILERLLRLKELESEDREKIEQAKQRIILAMIEKAEEKSDLNLLKPILWIKGIAPETVEKVKSKIKAVCLREIENAEQGEVYKLWDVLQTLDDKIVLFENVDEKITTILSAIIQKIEENTNPDLILKILQTHLSLEQLKALEKVIKKMGDSELKSKIEFYYIEAYKRCLQKKGEKTGFKLGDVFISGKIKRPKRRPRKRTDAKKFRRIKRMTC